MTLTQLAPDPVPATGPAHPLLVRTARAAHAVADHASGLTAPAGERWYNRLALRADHDLWLIVWGPDAGVALHDHGGSAGAFTVVSGALTELQPDDDTTHHADVTAGAGRSFGAGVRHAVRNPYRTSAVSIHAYSPALTTMTFFDGLHGHPRSEPVASAESRW